MKKSYKAVGDKILPIFVNKPRVIVYDNENIQYFVGNGASFEWEPQHMFYESMDGTRIPFNMGVNITLRLDETTCNDNIMLDDTTMRRIAVFNKIQECKRLDEEIKEKKEQIKEIEKILNDRTIRLKKLKEFVANIYDIDINDDDDEDLD